MKGVVCVCMINDCFVSVIDITDEIKLILADSLQYLLECQFVSKSSCNEERYHATQLGTATVASSLSPHEALLVFKEFSKARRSLVLENELHMIYLVSEREKMRHLRMSA